MATYTVDITSKAIRSFTTSIQERLVAMHRKADPNVDAGMVKVITNYLHRSLGNWLRTGQGRDEMNHRYMRVTIELIAGSKTAGEKEYLMRQTIECCQEYQEKHARETEIEVRIVEIEQANVMRVSGGINA